MKKVRNAYSTKEHKSRKHDRSEYIFFIGMVLFRPDWFFQLVVKIYQKK